MKEIREILRRVSAFGPSERAILATVVDVQGSGYRLPGARMLIMENGDTFGMVSGGCLEADVLERAQKVLKSGVAEVFTYDTTNDANSVFSLNMGCRGVIRVLLESVGRESVLLRTLEEVRRDRDPRTVATLIAADGKSEAPVGGRFFYRDGGHFDFDKFPPALRDDPSLRDECARFHASERTYGFHKFETSDGSYEFAFESLRPPILVLLFGAGADAMPLARIAADLGWQTRVFDHRPVFLTNERFPDADKLVLHNDENPLTPVGGDRRTVAVVMTHNYQHDIQILPKLIGSNIAYIAALGPKRRTEELLNELAAGGSDLTEEQLTRLYAPAGLDIGADTPEAIALSIVAEIQSVLQDRGAGYLRDRKGSIYDRK